MNKYEGMFLFDPAVATDWDKIKAELDRLMERAEARILECGKWDERRLAYDIRGRKRAIYVLAYFESMPDKIVPMERDVQLSESVLRVLILRADHVTEEEMKEQTAAATPRPAPETPSRGEKPAPGETKAPVAESAAPAAAPATATTEAPEAKAEAPVTETAEAPEAKADAPDATEKTEE